MRLLGIVGEGEEGGEGEEEEEAVHSAYIGCQIQNTSS